MINHLQDCQDDYRQLDRVYLPMEWLREKGIGVDVLDAPRCSPRLRHVIDRCLDATEPLLADARRLPGGLVSRRLAMESAAIVSIAERLMAKLRTEDPLAVRVALSKGGYLWRCVLGALPVALGVSR